VSCKCLEVAMHFSGSFQNGNETVFLSTIITEAASCHACCISHGLTCLSIECEIPTKTSTKKLITSSSKSSSMALNAVKHVGSNLLGGYKRTRGQAPHWQVLPPASQPSPGLLLVNSYCMLYCPFLPALPLI